MNENDRLVKRIDNQLRSGIRDEEDHRVLTYIRGELTPEGTARRARDEHTPNDVSHLQAVAKTRLRPYESNREDS